MVVGPKGPKPERPAPTITFLSIPELGPDADEFCMHHEVSPATNDRRGRSWDTTIRCSCGEFESKSRAEQWAHAAMALRGELAAALACSAETPLNVLAVLANRSDSLPDWAEPMLAPYRRSPGDD